MARTRKATETVELAKIASRERIIKFVAGCMLAAFAVWQISKTIVELKKSPGNSIWAEVLVAVIAPGGIVTVFMGAVVWFVKRFTIRMSSRVAARENAIDPGRESSGLREDGTDPPIGESQ
jgi:hypothetical protein